MWIPGRFTTVGIALTLVGIVLVLLTWETHGSIDHLTSRPNARVLWLAFPLCGVVPGWSLDLSRAGKICLYASMLMHWVVIGLLVDRALARRTQQLGADSGARG